MSDAVNKRRRGVLKLNLSRLKDQMAGLNQRQTLDIEKLSKLEAMLLDYKEHKIEFEREVNSALESLDETDPEFTNKANGFMKELKDICDVLYQNEGFVKAFHKKLSIDDQRQSLLPSAGHADLNASFRTASSCQPKLEKMSVPTFDGNILNFQNFKGLFENLIHNNNELSNVQKLHYLKQSLIGDAKDYVRDFSLDDRSYSEAWSHLLSRFDNKRAVVRTLFRSFYNLESIKHKNQVRTLLDKVELIIRGLKAANEQIDDTFSRYITFVVASKLDFRTCEDWENSIPSTRSYPKFDELQKFLQNRAFNVEDRSTETNHSTKPQTKTTKTVVTPTEKKSFATTSSNSSSSKIKCVVCQQGHYLNQCKIFESKNVSERFEIVKKNKLCIKCFNPYHSVSDCKRPECKFCNGNHHSMLHRENSTINRTQTQKLENQQSTTTTTSNSDVNSHTSNSTSDTINNSNVTKSSFTGVSFAKKCVFLPTAVVKVKTGKSTLYARVMLDGCSENTLISRNYCNNAKLPILKNDNPTVLSGINEGSSILNSLTKFVLQSRYSSFTIAVEAEIIKKIPYNIPKSSVSKIVENLPNLKFAESDDVPYTEVDILLGAEYVEFIIEEQRHFIEGICLKNTKFGYVITGAQRSSFLTTKSFCGMTKIDIDSQIKRFFEIEDAGENSSSKNSETLLEHKLIEEHFESTYKRLENGKFQLELPKRSTIVNLNGSFGKARSMLIKSEQKRKHNPTIDKAYCEFMFKYEQLNHMTKLSNPEILKNLFYLPHHIVTKITSSTTKNRAVFNASSIDESGTSLNDQLLIGPTLQPELFDTIIKFRLHSVAFCADIEMMYRQILIHPNDRKYQRILWRTNSNEPIGHYELNTVTYGTGPASYLATKCLQIISRELEISNPTAAKAINSNFYMDDLMTGANTVEEALHLQKTVHTALLGAGFPLRKYQSNSTEFLNNIDQTLIETLNTRLLGAESFIYLLGLIWCPLSDIFNVAIKLNDLPKPITKRIMLSDISRIFDVLGMLAPVTIKAKILMQDLWREGIDWNDAISPELEKEFLTYRKNLETLSNYQIPRCYSTLKNVNYKQLVGFCDASPKAYCAIIFIRTINDENETSVAFVCAKTRVAPIKALTIPRLELQSAVILSQLLIRIATNLNIDVKNIHAFSDSQIALSWINHPPERLKQYVSNRVSKIQQLLPNKHWSYVETKSNPADLATRGLTVDKFMENKLWLNGPEWLTNDFESHINSNFDILNNIPEIREKKVSFLIKFDIFLSAMHKFSTFNRCINVFSYFYRYFNNLKTKIKSTGPLTVEERDFAIKRLIHYSQLEFFGNEYEALTNKIPLNKNSKLFALNVFLDKDNLIRVGGRLAASKFSYDTKFPIVMHRKSRFIELLVLHTHKLYYHATKSFLINFIRNKYWVIGGLIPLVKKTVYQCVHCTRINAKLAQQFMGDLPTERTTISRPFTTTGVDLSGFYQVKCTNHRSTKYNKVYIAFFVCFVTRAVHIELVIDLSTESFIMALERFISRRGLPQTIYSDNGTNFVGTNNIFEQNKIESFATSKAIKWKFIAPRSPHQGGLWESAVKSGKSCLFKAIGDQILNIDELTTVLTKVECILNSRPIAYKITNSLAEPLTPGHFLIGSSLLEIPISDDSTIRTLARYKLMRATISSFWHSWRSSYLNQLQTRNKWKEPQPNIQVGDVVLLNSPNSSVMDWPMGIVSTTYPDPNGLVRVVDVSTSSGVLRRSIQQLVKLPIEPT